MSLELCTDRGYAYNHAHRSAKPRRTDKPGFRRQDVINRGGKGIVSLIDVGSVGGLSDPWHKHSRLVRHLLNFEPLEAAQHTETVISVPAALWRTGRRLGPSTSSGARVRETRYIPPTSTTYANISTGCPTVVPASSRIPGSIVPALRAPNRLTRPPRLGPGFPPPPRPLRLPQGRCARRGFRHRARRGPFRARGLRRHPPRSVCGSTV